MSCTAAGDCLAVGDLVLAGSGGHWQVAAATSDLTAVSCTGTDSCAAVGADNVPDCIVVPCRIRAL